MKISSQNDSRLWVVSLKKEIKPITEKEKKIASKLSPLKAKEYTFVRGYTRFLLSKLFKIPALDIPLNAPLGKPPFLEDNLGYISLSHCKDAILIGWSNNELGVDIERMDRSFCAKGIANKFYSAEENYFLKNLGDDVYRYNVLKFWVLKEAAIKWQRGNIANDLSNWEVKSNFRSSFHNSLKIKLETSFLEFDEWLIGIAYKNPKQKIKKMTFII